MVETFVATDVAFASAVMVPGEFRLGILMSWLTENVKRVIEELEEWKVYRDLVNGEGGKKW